MPGPAASPARPDARIRRFLEQEAVVWLSSVRADGLPHVVPVWFLWDGRAILVFSKPHAVKVAALRRHPRAMLALGDAEADFDVGLIEARAEVLDGPVALPPAFVAKYADRLGPAGLDPATFAATYPLAIRLVPTRYLPWRGRGVAEEGRPALDAGRLTRLRAAVDGLHAPAWLGRLSFG